MKDLSRSFILISLILAIFSIGCDRAGTKEESFDLTQETVKVPYTIYSNEDRGFSFEVPTDWEVKVKTDTDTQFLLNVKSPAFDPDTTDKAKVKIR